MDDKNQTTETKQEDKQTTNYLEFKTKDDFNNYIDKYLDDYRNQIISLQDENKSLKSQDVEIKKLNDKLNIFTNHLLNKYEIKNAKLDKTKFDYSSYDNLEKSILKICESENIKYKKANDDLKKENSSIPKIYI